eukprot:TRINITY_DN32288_c0_g1_i2.p1 TRINITY_DN32288_c0_g1~~TRINITY_DN32288_c0_g1_i2.p1  ORF type:complete len:593 (-),score=157.21 TRINITY_DN32288_c0_g1_i2:131-1909(-)
MFDFDELDDVETDSSAAAPPSKDGRSTEPAPGPASSSEPAAQSASPQVVGAGPEKSSNSKYSVGMALESVGSAIPRAQDALESEQVGSLPANSREREGDTQDTERQRQAREAEVERAKLEQQAAQRRAEEAVQERLRAQKAEEQRKEQQAAQRREDEAARERLRAQEAEEQRKVQQAAQRRAEEAARESLRAQKAEEQRRISEAQASRNFEAAKSTSNFQVGDTCVCTGVVLMRENQSLGGNNPLICRLAADDEVELLEIGTDPSAKRVKVKDAKGNKGWVSIVTSEGKSLLELKKTLDPNMFSGAGNTLGGGSRVLAEDPRKAALAAAERRQASALSHGVGEEKAKQLRETGQREAVLRKISEIYSRKKEDVPIALQSASLESLQKHLEHLQSSATLDPTATKPSAAAASSAAATGRPATQSPLVPRMADSLRAVPPPGGYPVQGLNTVDQRTILIQEAAAAYKLTKKEIDSVTDLENLGFDFARALEAFLACERNQELAANYLLESQVAAAELSNSASSMGALGAMPFISSRLPPAFPGPAPNEQNLNFARWEWDSVRRLQELGFDRPTALKAFISCGKDEEMAGNRLLT